MESIRGQETSAVGRIDPVIAADFANDAVGR